MRFKIMSVSPDEYLKADNNPGYSPKEWWAGVIEADNLSQANRKLTKLIKLHLSHQWVR